MGSNDDSVRPREVAVVVDVVVVVDVGDVAVTVGELTVAVDCDVAESTDKFAVDVVSEIRVPN